NWGWVWKAYFRHKFDLITGAIYTRALTLSARKAGRDVRLISWGSCQTPTLWFIMERERQIRSFKPETYYTLEALVKISNIVLKLSSRTIKSEAEAKALYERAKQAEAALVEAFTSQREVERRPLPAETDSMLQDLTKILGVSGAKIMAEAEQLYAEGYISYPRTQTNQWVDVDHHRILLMLASSQLAGYVKLENLNPRNGSKNDGAHPPIYPTKVYSYRDFKGRIWEYLARRYLANTVYDDAIYRRWKLVANLAGVRLEASGRHFVDEGFYKVYPYFKPRELQWVPELHPGDRLPVLEVKLVKRKTKPPPRLSESELLRLLEAHGIGTDATRHEFPAIVLSRGYAVKQGKTFKPTELGEQLLNLLSMVDRRLVTPETRRLVEETMARVEKGEIESEKALREVLKVYRELYLKLEETLKLNPPLGICQGGSSG
ncbi:MAG: DNA topoisomerase, partial [Candidatus Hecatellaceae archaeon]